MARTKAKTIKIQATLDAEWTKRWLNVCRRWPGTTRLGQIMRLIEIAEKQERGETDNG
ncbi:MAG: hypothetical protein PHF37_08465 [Phycisphaerae bacterium]|jgi:hypothetical protein|nr:hypothetical protein [Phycisphaerae bacterium]